MQDWIHGSQVRSLVKMTELEIIRECITKSLTPHNDHGLPIKPADVMVQHISDFEQELSRLDELAWDLSGAAREKMIVDQIEPLQERLEELRTYHESIKTSSWGEFGLPADQDIKDCFASFLVNSRYRAEEVNRILLNQPGAPHEARPPAPEFKSPRSAHAQTCKKECRKIAQRIWDRQPDFTIAAMINHSEILHQARKPDGSYHSEMTIRNWIRDLCPNPKRGRRPGGSQAKAARK